MQEHVSERGKAKTKFHINLYCNSSTMKGKWVEQKSFLHNTVAGKNGIIYFVSVK